MKMPVASAAPVAHHRSYFAFERDVRVQFLSLFFLFTFTAAGASKNVLGPGSNALRTWDQERADNYALFPWRANGIRTPSTSNPQGGTSPDPPAEQPLVYNSHKDSLDEQLERTNAIGIAAAEDAKAAPAASPHPPPPASSSSTRSPRTSAGTSGINGTTVVRAACSPRAAGLEILQHKIPARRNSLPDMIERTKGLTIGSGTEGLICGRGGPNHKEQLNDQHVESTPAMLRRESTGSSTVSPPASPPVSARKELRFALPSGDETAPLGVHQVQAQTSERYPRTTQGKFDWYEPELQGVAGSTFIISGAVDPGQHNVATRPSTPLPKQEQQGKTNKFQLLALGRMSAYGATSSSAEQHRVSTPRAEQDDRGGGSVPLLDRLDRGTNKRHSRTLLSLCRD